MLQEQGLPAGLIWLGDHMKQHELAITVEIQKAFDVPLPEDRAVLLFQSVRGLLINVAKHGVMKKAAVRMVYRDGFLQSVVIGLSVNRSPVTEQKMKAGGASAYGGAASSGGSRNGKRMSAHFKWGPGRLSCAFQNGKPNCALTPDRPSPKR